MVIENIIEICVAIDIAILGIAYPIIVDKTSNIGVNFNSQYIPVLFDYEFPQKEIGIRVNQRNLNISYFKLALYLTILSFLFIIVKFPPPFGWDNYVINNSANLFVLIMTIILTILFFMWLDKVVLYNGKSKSLLAYLVSKHNTFVEDTETKLYHLKAINELTFYAIEKQDNHLQETLLDFYYHVFTTIRKKHDKNKPLEYPIDLYLLVSNLNLELSGGHNKKLMAIEHRAVSGVWLLGEDFEEITISEKTYKYLWSNLFNICDNDRLIKKYWAASSQYYNYRLKLVPSGLRQINEEAHQKRNIEIHDFIEFHHVLGGLILYRKQYKSLQYFLEFTQSQPPRYALLPESMTEIFIWFENFHNDFSGGKNPIDMRFYYPELDHLGNSGKVKFWICSYLSVLFIRQYSLHTYYTYQDFTGQPNLPEDIFVLNSWLDSVSYFEYCLNKVKTNEAMLNELGFLDIVEKESQKFQDFVNELKSSIKEKITEKKLNANLSDKKIQAFFESSNIIISDALMSYDPVINKEVDNFDNYDSQIHVKGETILLSKAAFTDNDIQLLNYDSVLASQIAHNSIKFHIPYSFALSRTKRYLLNKSNIITALDKIIGSKDDAIIIGVNVNDDLNEAILSSKLKSQINLITSTIYEMADVLFVLSKSDLPSIEYCALSQEKVDELQLQVINKDLKLYASVIDLNTPENAKLKNKWGLENASKSEDLKVQITVEFDSIIHWKKVKNLIQINIASEYKEQGIQNHINDVKSIN